MGSVLTKSVWKTNHSSFQVLYLIDQNMRVILFSAFQNSMLYSRATSINKGAYFLSKFENSVLRSYHSIAFQLKFCELAIAYSICYVIIIAR